MRIIRKSSFTPKAWKNGGGVTHEAIRVPADGDMFDWRVSVARIDASGPFSDFPAHRRTMVLLEGDGIELQFSDGGRRSLQRVGDSAQFDGGIATYCTLLGGGCVDLNLMVAKPRASVAVVQRLTPALGSIDARAARGESTLIFSIDGAIELTADGAEPEILQRWDLAVISDVGARVARPQSHASANASAVFLATIRQ